MIKQWLPFTSFILFIQDCNQSTPQVMAKKNCLNILQTFSQNLYYLHAPVLWLSKWHSVIHHSLLCWIKTISDSGVPRLLHMCLNLKWGLLSSEKTESPYIWFKFKNIIQKAVLWYFNGILWFYTVKYSLVKTYSPLMILIKVSSWILLEVSWWA